MLKTAVLLHIFVETIILFSGLFYALKVQKDWIYVKYIYFY